MPTAEDRAREKLIVALDVDSAEKALDLARLLAPEVGMMKIGLELFTSEGPDIVRRIVDTGARVFLDLKFHDIPNTVARAVAAAARLGVSMMNVHASGGVTMMRAAREAADRARPGNAARPVLLAVTVLTSLDAEALAQVGVDRAPEEQVVELARLARSAGMDGVVASAREVAAIRNACGREFVAVTPGIRPAGGATEDQKRVVTPADAIRAGADYLVAGRPITEAAEPVAAARAIVREMAEALRGG